MTASMDDVTDLTPLDAEPEGEPGELIHEEVERLAHHPGEEVVRLRSEASDGESGATPFIAIGALVPALLAVVLALAFAALAVYYLVR